jgi:hypothetical protein
LIFRGVQQQTSGVVVLAIFVVLVILTLAAALRLLWRAARGDIQIEPTSHGRQFFGRSEKNRDDS